MEYIMNFLKGCLLRRGAIGLFALVLTAFIAGSAFSQGNELSLDHVDGLYNNDPTQLETDVPITFHIRFSVAGAPNVANIVGAVNGFRVYSPDGATWQPITYVPYLNLSTFEYVVVFPGWSGPGLFNDNLFINPYSVTGSGADTIGLGGNSKFPSPGIPAGFSEVVYTISTQVDDAQHGKTLCLDSTWYRPANNWLWSSDTGAFGTFSPDWDGPHCFTIRDPDFVQPSNLVISTDSIFFNAIEGATSPPFQSFGVDTDFDPLNFTVSESATWLSLSPTSGVTPQSINVFVSTGSLPVGTYYANITVNSPSAANTPQTVVVKLVVEPPPPVIGVSQTLIQFFAIADGANPDDKILTVTNEGGSTLMWDASNFSSWLSISPTSGTDLGDITLSVDITGLVFGTYFDTITVSDPAASNDPVEVEVKLTIGSNLPLIEVDSAFNSIIVPDGSQSIPNRTIKIRNGGIGVMNFTLQESSGAILTLTPSSGTAPQEVAVGFKVLNGLAGTDNFDTLWVHSNEAVNSPFPVVFRFHYVANPAFLTVNKDTVEFTLYQCDRGVFGATPTRPFYVQNTGGDNPVQINLIYDSTLFRSNLNFATAPHEFTLVGKDPQVPFGVYYDTILISSYNAINAPETLIVKSTVAEPQSAPQIYLNNDSIVINLKESSSPPAPFDFTIYNLFPGCMEWTITESVPWMQFTNLFGNVPGKTTISIDANGFTRGAYPDSFQVSAPSASNDPRWVDVQLNVWWHRGDVNWDGKINIGDVTWMINYLFGIPTGPPPQPEPKLGDLNCDGKINIGDLVYMIQYLFGIPTGPFPCANP